MEKMRYIRPKEIKNDMGGESGNLDSRMKEIFTLLKKAPKNINTICDIGMGQGQISEYFAQGGVKVTGTGVEMSSYGIEKEEWERKGIRVVECDVENMPFEDGEFDAVVASHVLEHVPNMGQALSEIRRIIKDDGWLFLFMPAYTDYVCAGHINIGWNLGQLIYILLLNGFDVKNGHFIHYGYSLCAYVKKKDIQLPPLRGDRGDIHILNKSGLWPFEIKGKDGICDGFSGGQIKSVNWDGAENMKMPISIGKKKAIILKLLDLWILVMRKIFGVNLCNKIAERMKYEEELYNPKEL